MTDVWQLCSQNERAREIYVLSAIFLIEYDDDYIIFIMIELRIRWISQCYSSRFLAVWLVQMKYIDHCANILHRFFSMSIEQMTTIRFKHRNRDRDRERENAVKQQSLIDYSMCQEKMMNAINEARERQRDRAHERERERGMRRSCSHFERANKIHFILIPIWTW